MKVMVLLADFAQGGPGEKVNAIGLGWAKTSTPLGQHSIVVMFETSAGDPEVPGEFDIKLLNESGTVVPDGSGNPISLNLTLERGEAAHPPVQTVTPFCLSIAPGLALEPGLYRWEVSSPELSEERWERAFEVLPRADT